MKLPTRPAAALIAATLLVGAACSSGGTGRETHVPVPGMPRIVAAEDPESPASGDVLVPFGEVRVGDETTREFLLINDGDESISVLDVRQSEGFAAEFSYEMPSREVGPHQRAVFTIAFAPGTPGYKNELLVFAFSNSALAEIRLYLHAVGGPEPLRCEGPAVDDACRVDFFSVPTRARRYRNVAFWNGSAAPVALSITGLTQPENGTAPFSLETDQRQFVISSGATLTLAVSFFPTTIGEQVGALHYAFGARLTPRVVELAGVGLSAKISVAPKDLDFGPVAIGMAEVLSVSVRNEGLDLSGTIEDELIFAVPGATGNWERQPPFIVGPDAAEFSLAPARDYGAVGIPGGASDDVFVTFTPKSTGTKTATLLIYSNDVETPLVRVPLSGTALVLPPCDFEVVPPSVDFGSVESNAQRTRSFVIRNRAVDPADTCLIRALDVTEDTRIVGAFSLDAGPVDSKFLAGGESLEIAVTFAPKTDGTYGGGIAFAVSNPDAPRGRVALIGIAQPACLMVAPRQLDFGSLGVHCSSRQRLFTMYNTCTAPLTVERIELQSGSSADFTLTKLPALPATIGGGSSAEFGVTFKPSTPGEASASVLVTMAADPSSPGPARPIPLEGRGVEDPPVTDSFTVPEPPSVDYLFVVDNSVSMADKQATLASAFDDLILFLVRQHVDYHIAVTTTDTTVTGAAGRLMPLTGSDPRVITPSTPNKPGVFAQNANVGTSGSDAESLLYPAYLAITDPLLTGHNTGFYRQAARLRVIVISDAADQDSPGRPVSFYETFFTSMKSSWLGNNASLSVVVPAQAQPAAPCTYDDANAGTDVRARQVAAYTGGEIFEICDPGWPSQLQSFLARDTIPPTSYFLSNIPDLYYPITITVDGQPYPQYSTHGAKRWDYDPSRNTIVFDPLATPDWDATFAVTYHVACL